MTNTKYTADLTISPITDYTVGRRKGARASIQSNLVDCTTEVYNENELFTVKWKSKAWSKLSNFATQVTAKALRGKLELSENVSVTFSVYAGCSPGYIIRAKNDEGQQELRLKGLVNVDIYGKIKFNNDALVDFVKRSDLFNTEFLAERRANGKV